MTRTSNEDPMVSVIIVNYNGEKYLENCLKSLYQTDYNKYETILVDNNSSDKSIEYVKNNYPQVIIIKLDKNRGFAEPNNIGAKNAKGEFLLFLNNDTIVTHNFISELLHVATKNEKIAICQSMLLTPNGDVDSSGDYIDSLGVSYSCKKRVDNVREILSAKAASMMIRKKIFYELGGFDEKFFASFEDVDLGWRAWIVGYSAVIIPNSVVFHLGGQTIKNMEEEIAFHGLKNQLSMRITNFETPVAVNRLLRFFITYGIKLVRVAIDYQINGATSIKATKYEDTIARKPNIKIILKSIFWLLKNSSYLYEKHKRVNSSRVIPTKEIRVISPNF